MVAVSFDALPPDILLSILVHSPPTSVRRCQQVCRSLRSLISTNDRLQYILQLDSSGYVEPLHPRTDLSYAEKTRILREHNAQWDNPTIVTPVHHELPSYRVAGVDALVNGTFVWCQGIGSESCRIVFYQFPSTNRGADFKQWSFDMENEYDGFWIDPEQDLLVVAEARGSWASTEPYHIHLRSMSTNEPHPRAVGRSVLCYTPLRDSWHNGWRIRIFDRLLAGLFQLVGGGINIVIWDWTTGRELTYLTFTDEGAYHSFELLSESSFVICCSLCSPDIDPGFLKNTFGWLRVYQFDPQVPVPMQATHVVSFALPEGKSTPPYHGLTLHSGPIVSSLGTRSHRGFSAKVYDLAVGDRLLRVDVSFPVLSASPSPVGSLYVSSSILLDALSEASQDSHQPTPKLVAWAKWADRVFWVDHSKFHPHRRPHMFGQRLVAQQMQDRDTQLPSVCVLDFDRRRLMAEDASALGDVRNTTQAAGYTQAGTIYRKSTLAVEGVNLNVIRPPGQPVILAEEFRTWIDEEHRTSLSRAAMWTNY